MSNEIIHKKDDMTSNINNRKDEDGYENIDRHNVGLVQGGYFIFMIFFSQIMWKLFRIKM